jgi:hypothetical protein
MWPLAQQVYDPPAMWVRQRRESPVESWGAQLGRSNLKPLACSISRADMSRTGCAKVQ